MPVHILIIDDEIVIVQVLSKLLTYSSYKVTMALSGEEGLALFRNQEVDLVIVDIYMPGINGLEVIRQIKDESPSTPIIAISGGTLFGQEDLLPQAKDVGAKYVLKKPLTNQILLSTIEDALGLSAP